MHKPFKGTFFYELQVGPLVFQLKRRDNSYPHKRLTVWRDPLWRS